jgi:hypothetical protein
MASMRKGNVSTHIQRKHPIDYNPFPEMKQTDCNFSKPKKPEPSNFGSQQFNLSDRTQYFGNSRKFQDILQQISQLSDIELMFLASAITKRLNTGSHSSYF